MSHAKLCLLLSTGVLACSGRYVSNSHDGAGAEVGVNVGGTVNDSIGGAAALPPDDTEKPPAGGATLTAGNGPGYGAPPPMVTDAACGVALGPPEEIPEPMTNGMLWWVRLSKLIWATQPHEVPPSWSDTISYQQAGQIADDAMNQAIAETSGIPGIEPFVRNLLHLYDAKVDLMFDWSRALSKGNVTDALLNFRFQPNRVGVFTEPGFLTFRPTASQRGAVMVEALFSQVVPPAPPNLPPFMPPDGLTRREGLSQAVAAEPCVACHTFFDPLGFALEHFDTAGDYVTLDAGKPVDASGSYRLPSSGGQLQFDGIEDLARQLTDTCAANLGLADRFLTFALEQNGSHGLMVANQESDRTRLRQAFMRSGRTYRSLIKAFAQGYTIRNTEGLF